MKILLIRHGEPDYEEDGLTEKGRREAAFLAGRIAPMEVKNYYVSPLGRAMETAEATLRKAGRKAEICPWLREFDIPIVEDNGVKRPVPWNWMPKKWLSDPRFFSAEHWSENEVLEKVGVGPAYEEVVSAFDKLLSEHGYRREGTYYRVEEANTDTLVFFTHFGLSCVLLSHLFNCSPMVLWHGLIMAPSSVTTLFTEETEKGIAVFRAAVIGDVSHLYANGEEPSSAGRFQEVYD